MSGGRSIAARLLIALALAACSGDNQPPALPVDDIVAGAPVEFGTAGPQ
jgi:hypothetical protein